MPSTSRLASNGIVVRSIWKGAGTVGVGSDVLGIRVGRSVGLDVRVAVGVEDGDAVGVGERVAVEVRVGVGEAVGEGVIVCVGRAVGDTIGVGVGVGLLSVVQEVRANTDPMRSDASGIGVW